MADPTVEHVRTHDGRRLAVERTGAGAPTVVFEAGMGTSRRSWGAVAPVVAAQTEVAAYDRSGFGDSPPDPEPRPLDRLADDLGEVLDHLGEGPFVLVGFSWGGPIVRVVAARRPERVAGLVLVDQTDEGCDLYFRGGAERQERMFAALLPTLARVGVTRLVARRATAGLADEVAQPIVQVDGGLDAARAHAAELRSCTRGLRTLRDDPPPLPDVPVTVISGTRASRVGQKQRDALLLAHRATAAAAPEGRHVEAAASGHAVPLSEPQLVADEVLRVVDLVRAGST